MLEALWSISSSLIQDGGIDFADCTVSRISCCVNTGGKCQLVCAKVVFTLTAGLPTLFLVPPHNIQTHKKVQHMQTSCKLHSQLQ